jgi:hypothetical protein
MEQLLENYINTPYTTHISINEIYNKYKYNNNSNKLKDINMILMNTLIKTNNINEKCIIAKYFYSYIYDINYNTYDIDSGNLRYNELNELYNEIINKI